MIITGGSAAAASIGQPYIAYNTGSRATISAAAAALASFPSLLRSISFRFSRAHTAQMAKAGYREPQKKLEVGPRLSLRTLLSYIPGGREPASSFCLPAALLLAAAAADPSTA
uniref:Uncharacterized protein n=1 Tax=Trichogramma kaykai TaxID=54128 RepID=A0ABD2WB86_9HYME